MALNGVWGSWWMSHRTPPSARRTRPGASWDLKHDRGGQLAPGRVSRCRSLTCAARVGDTALGNHPIRRTTRPGASSTPPVPRTGAVSIRGNPCTFAGLDASIAHPPATRTRSRRSSCAGRPSWIVRSFPTRTSPSSSTLTSPRTPDWRPMCLGDGERHL